MKSVEEVSEHAKFVFADIVKAAMEARQAGRANLRTEAGDSLFYFAPIARAPAGAEQSDDITMLALRYLGRSA